jgi:sulfate permease, SulP family
LRMGNVPFVDATGIFALEEIITDFKQHGTAVLLVEVRPNVRFKLERGGVVAHVGAENVIDTLEQALLRAKELRPAVKS